MIFLKNNLKRAGLIFPILLAFSYDLGAMEVLQPEKFTNFFRVTHRVTKKTFDLIGTRHLLPYDVLSKWIRELIENNKEAKLCLKEVSYENGNKRLASYKKKEQELLGEYFDECKDFLQVFESNKKKYIKTEEDTSNYLSFFCYSVSSQKILELGFKILFPDLAQKGLKIESFNKNALRLLLEFNCMNVGKNRRKIMDVELILAGKVPYSCEQQWCQKNPHWLQPEKNKINYLNKLTAKQREILERLFEDPEPLKDYNVEGLWQIYNCALQETKGMDNTIASFFTMFHPLDGNPECLKIKRDFDALRLDRYPSMKSQNSIKEENKGDTKETTQDNTASSAIQQLGKKLEQECPDGTYEYLHTDYANLPEVQAKELMHLDKSIVKDRNKLWMPQILKIFEQIKAGTLTHPETDKTVEDMLLVFGASHLYGKYGILNLLFDEDFDIYRAKPSKEFFPYLTHEKPIELPEETKS